MSIIRQRDPLMKTFHMDGSEIKRDRVRKYAEGIVLQHRERIKTTREFDPQWMYWFRRKKTGRRCSCFNIEDSPDGVCGVCYSTGFSGGYDKFGYETHVIDVSSPNVSLVNVVPWYESMRRPTPFVLGPGASRGFIEVALRLRKSHGLDVLKFVASRDDNTVTYGQVRAWNDGAFVDLTRESLAERMVGPSPTVVVRFWLERKTRDATPILSHAILRHRVSDTFMVPLDLPQHSESIQLLEIGVVESLSTLQGWTTYEFGKPATEDFFVPIGRLPQHVIERIRRTTNEIAASGKLVDEKGEVINGLRASMRTAPRLKVIGVTPSSPMGIDLSYTMDLRQVFSYEGIAKVDG